MAKRGYGATVARLTPDQKVGSSNLSALILLNCTLYQLLLRGDRGMFGKEAIARTPCCLFLWTCLVVQRPALTTFERKDRIYSMQAGVWRNGSASDSRSEGWEFESLCPHFAKVRCATVWLGDRPTKRRQRSCRDRAL